MELTEKYQNIVDLAEFMVNAIAMFPEEFNPDGTVKWEDVQLYVEDVYVGMYDEDMFEEAVDLIISAAAKVTQIPPGTTIH